MNSSYLSVTTTTKIIAENEKYDVIIVDEPDKLDCNSQLEILQRMGQQIILMHNVLQTIKPDNSTREMFKKLTAGYKKKVLHTQFRI